MYRVIYKVLIDNNEIASFYELEYAMVLSKEYVKDIIKNLRQVLISQ